MPTTAKDIARKTRCGACGGQVRRVNFVMIELKATWEYPTAGNVVTGESGRAVAVVCDACIDAQRRVREAVEFRGDEVVYHPLESLEKI
jgi:hypothetical protein